MVKKIVARMNDRLRILIFIEKALSKEGHKGHYARGSVFPQTAIFKNNRL
jgi:hypothetical protein